MEGESIPARLRAALRDAMRAKDTAAVSGLRSALAAIANAEAVPPPDRTPIDKRSFSSSSRIPDSQNITDSSSFTDSTHISRSTRIAGGVAGVGSAETARRVLSDAETARIVHDEITEREAAADGYDASGHPDRAARLRLEAQALRAAIADL